MNDFQLDRLEVIIKKYAKDARVGILGLSYKPGTYVVEESPGIKLANRLNQNGYKVSVYDPMALSEAKRSLEEEVYSAASIIDCLNRSSMVLIMTNWPEFSENITPELIRKSDSCNLIIDCWRTLDQKQFKESCRVIYLGQGTDQKLEELATV